MRFIDLFAGIGGFHCALDRLGHKCVFASELDPELQELYKVNFPSCRNGVSGDIRRPAVRDSIPAHDVLCAGFPCQPFSKSGTQRGTKDCARGTLFHEILSVLEDHRPTHVILENVGNFERHDQGRTWAVVRTALEDLQYNVAGTTHIASGGPGLVSPHHLGFPHTRERFYIVASRQSLPSEVFPRRDTSLKTTLNAITQRRIDVSASDWREARLAPRVRECIEHWNALIGAIPMHVQLPSFPMWGDEINASYPYDGRVPASMSLSALRRCVAHGNRKDTREELLAALPSYARVASFPAWKKRYIKQNREWFAKVAKHFPAGWVERLRGFPPSHRKLEWNCQGEVRDLWRHVLQFRPSGLRVKRYSSCPALVSMTETQVPILGPKGRYITRVEGLRLQGFPDSHQLPQSRARAFSALGNAVHVDVVACIAGLLIGATTNEARRDRECR